MGWVPRPGCDALARDMGEHELVVGSSISHTTCFTSNKDEGEETEPCNHLDRAETGSEHFSASPRRSRSPCPPPPCSAAPIGPPARTFQTQPAKAEVVPRNEQLPAKSGRKKERSKLA